ncbi:MULTISPECIES: DUF1266 domain-containing protein [unclassified Clostridium]|uniref:DUF1266 domain-containing protein n=1 Tax=unclassified Clostridium TaxID=2614128 RepID=UPI00207A7BBA|nr:MULTISPECIES: DUF1266 domain-containing protein [unclassified Clostridium]
MDGIIIIGIILYILYIVFFGRDKGLDIYKEMTTPTMKFIGAAGYNTYANADCNGVDIGGMYVCLWAKKHMKKLLKSGWNIKNRDDLESTIAWLFNEGHNEECMELMKIYKENPESNRIKKKQKELFDTLCSEYENQGILAWDICRICNLAGWGFLSGYISYQEAIKVSVDACKVLQANYTSWDHMMNSYFCGLAFWNGPAQSSPKSRAQSYNLTKQSKDSIYNIPWDTDLDAKDFIMPRKNERKNVKLLEL